MFKKTVIRAACLTTFIMLLFTGAAGCAYGSDRTEKEAPCSMLSQTIYEEGMETWKSLKIMMLSRGQSTLAIKINGAKFESLSRNVSDVILKFCRENKSAIDVRCLSLSRGFQQRSQCRGGMLYWRAFSLATKTVPIMDVPASENAKRDGMQIMPRECALRSGPGTRFSVRGTLEANQLVMIRGRQRGWRKVYLVEEEIEGWTGPACWR